MGEATLKTKSQFNKYAGHYEEEGFWNWYFLKSANKLASIILSQSKNSFKKKLHFLDLGCGTGTLISKLNKIFPDGNLEGIDVSENMLNEAQKKFANSRNITLHLGDINLFDFPPLHYDFITCANSFHHYEDYSTILERVHSSLNVGQYFILLDPIKDGLLRNIWCNLLKSKLFDEPFARYFKRKQLTNLLTQNGFQLVRSETFLYFIWISIWKKI